MAIVGSTVKHRVDIIETERGWGSKIDRIEYFDSKADAEEFVKEFNSKNTDTLVPDWYMYANYVGKV